MTAYIYALPLVVWFGMSLIKKYRLRCVKMALVIALVIIVINIGQYWRNYDLFGSVKTAIGQGPKSYACKVISVPTASSSVVRNVALHMGTLRKIDVIWEKAIDDLHIFFGLDTNDPRTTLGNSRLCIFLSFADDAAGNPLHLAAIIFCLFFLLFDKTVRRSAGYFAAALLAGFILFSVYLKWQPHASRLHLPIFVLWTPVIGLCIGRFKLPAIAGSLAVLLLLSAMPWLFYSQSHPLVGEKSILFKTRTEQYFTNNPVIKDSYIRAARMISGTGCENIGLICGSDDWEYPLWVLLTDDFTRKVRIRHLNVANASGRFIDRPPFNGFSPDAVLMISDNPPRETRIGIDTYSNIWYAKPVCVLIRK